MPATKNLDGSRLGGLNNRRRLVCAAVACTVLTGGGYALAADASAISLDAARSAAQSGEAVLFDIREPHEHATGVAAEAKLLPMKQLEKRLSEIPKDKPVLLICRTENRSSATAKSLQGMGYTNVRHVEGGMSEWAKRGWPMVKPAP